MNKNLEEIISQLVEVVKESDSYKDYIKAKEKVEGQQDALAKIDEIRSLNMRLQTIKNSEQAYDEQDRLLRRFDELSEDQRVYDFIEAENRFIAKYQEIHNRVMEEIGLV